LTEKLDILLKKVQKILNNHKLQFKDLAFPFEP